MLPPANGERAQPGENAVGIDRKRGERKIQRDAQRESQRDENAGGDRPARQTSTRSSMETLYKNKNLPHSSGKVLRLI